MYCIEKHAISKRLYVYEDVKRNFWLNQLKIVAIASYGCSTVIIICDIAATNVVFIAGVMSTITDNSWFLCTRQMWTNPFGL